MAHAMYQANEVSVEINGSIINGIERIEMEYENPEFVTQQDDMQGNVMHVLNPSRKGTVTLTMDTTSKDIKLLYDLAQASTAFTLTLTKIMNPDDDGGPIGAKNTSRKKTTDRCIMRGLQEVVYYRDGSSTTQDFEILVDVLPIL